MQDHSPDENDYCRNHAMCFVMPGVLCALIILIVAFVSPFLSGKRASGAGGSRPVIVGTPAVQATPPAVLVKRAS